MLDRRGGPREGVPLGDCCTCERVTRSVAGGDLDAIVAGDDGFGVGG